MCSPFLSFCCSLPSADLQGLFSFLFFFWPCHVACGILVPLPGIELLSPMVPSLLPSPGPAGTQNENPAVKTWSPNHRPIREFPVLQFYFRVVVFFLSLCIKHTYPLNLIFCRHLWILQEQPQLHLTLSSGHWEESCSGLSREAQSVPKARMQLDPFVP